MFLRKVNFFYLIRIRRAKRRKKDKSPSFRRLFCRDDRLPRFRFVLYKDLMPRTAALYISWVIDQPKFCPSWASRRYRRSDAHFFGRLIFRRARHININSMYEICQNEFRLGAAAPDHHFSSRGECDLDVKYRCIIARAREEYQVGR